MSLANGKKRTNPVKQNPRHQSDFSEWAVQESLPSTQNSAERTTTTDDVAI